MTLTLYTGSAAARARARTLLLIVLAETLAACARLVELADQLAQRAPLDHARVDLLRAFVEARDVADLWLARLERAAKLFADAHCDRVVIDLDVFEGSERRAA